MRQKKPDLNKSLDSDTFRDYYYLKEELVQFCRENELSTSGGKIELANRIAYFLDTGKTMPVVKSSRKTASIGNMELESLIEKDFVCSEKHRAFFKEHIGKSFSFNVAFQKWLKSNSGKTYAEAVEAYHKIIKEKKNSKISIDKQFEYNIYIRDFFEDNTGMSLQDAIKCWNHKKQQPGHNRYEKSDLSALD